MTLSAPLWQLPAVALTPEQEAVALHASREIGPVHGMIGLRAPREDSLPMALLHIPPTEHKPFQILVTAGMSARAMPVPDDVEDEAEHIELVLGLPPDWPVEDASPEKAWPLQLLARLARFPSEAEAWLCPGHTIPNGNPPHPYASDTQLSCALIAPPLTLLPEAKTLAGPQGEVQLLAVVPVFEREVELKVEKGSDELFSRLDEHGVTEILDPHRRAVAGGTLFDLLDEKAVKTNES